MQLLFCLTLSTVFFAFFSWIRITTSPSCQVYPSEYAYQDRSVTRAENASANCRRYATNLDPNVFTHNYIHCNGTHLQLTDSNLGQEQYYQFTGYYQWDAGSAEQLLFIFPTRVSLTTITLHYYSDKDYNRSLPRLTFFAVPDDFDVWYGPTLSNYTYVNVTAVPPGEEPAGRRNISINVNFNTKRVLMYKFSSAYVFLVSEVEFFICENASTSTGPGISTMDSTAPEAPSIKDTDHTSTTTSTKAFDSTTEKTTDKQRTLQWSTISLSGVVAWVLVIILTVLFTGLLSVVLLWMFKKGQARDTSTDISTPKYEMEGNPCYEATVVKQTTDIHLYEAVRDK